jgi:hypothetical protein
MEVPKFEENIPDTMEKPRVLYREFFCDKSEYSAMAEKKYITRPKHLGIRSRNERIKLTLLYI